MLLLPYNNVVMCTVNCYTVYSVYTFMISIILLWITVQCLDASIVYPVKSAGYCTGPSGSR